MLTDDHKSRKQDAYWADLVGGDTGQYKAAVLDRLLRDHFPGSAHALLDIGCGTNDIAFAHRARLGAPVMVCADYDPAIVARMKAEHAGSDIDWRVADIFDIDRWEDRFDIVFLLDMLHEVYSFRGREQAGVPGPIDHAKGMAALDEAMTRIARIVAPGGAIAITDNVLCPKTGPVDVKLRNPAVRAAVTRFLAEYPSRRMVVAWPEPDVLRIAAHDLCILLTQYNKIKSGEEARWRVEQLEIHQYLDEAGYRALFDRLGFDVHCVIATPAPALAEWREDFTVLDGLPDLPPKRVTLLAVRRPA